MEEEIGTCREINPGCDYAAPTMGLLNESESENEIYETETLQEVPLALQNPVVLNNLFQLCPLKQLAPLRLVCKEWHQLSLPIWRANLPVTFSQDESIIRLVPKRKKYGYAFESYVYEYLDKPNTQTDKFPHRYLKLLHWHYDSTMYSLQRVWKAVGNNIQTLELHVCSFLKEEEFRLYKGCS